MYERKAAFAIKYRYKKNTQHSENIYGLYAWHQEYK